MDNATFHQGGRIQELIQTAGCRLLYLPPYSLISTCIEQCWSWSGSRIRKQKNQFDCLPDATCRMSCALRPNRRARLLYVEKEMAIAPYANINRVWAAIQWATVYLH